MGNKVTLPKLGSDLNYLLNACGGYGYDAKKGA